jgi:hypothetical protein
MQSEGNKPVVVRSTEEGAEEEQQRGGSVEAKYDDDELLAAEGDDVELLVAWSRQEQRVKMRRRGEGGWRRGYQWWSGAEVHR